MTTATQTIPVGYKRTEVGVIPNDWDVKICGELGSFYKGKGISSKDLVQDGLPCIMYGDIYVKFETKFSNPDFRINEITAAKSSQAKKGDLFFTGSGETAEEIGKCVVYQGNEDIYIGGDIIALTPNADIDSLFLAYIQNSKMILSQKANLGQGYTVVHIYTEHIKSLKIPFPPTKTEQTAIATVLSDTDELIEKLEKLIKKKKNIKQGAMQELLTGKRRLTGFSGKWAGKKISDICGKITTGKLNANAMVEGGEYRFYTCAKDYYQIDRYAFDTEALLVSGNGANVGYIHYYKGKFNAYQRTYVLSDFSADIQYIKLFMDRNLQERIRVEVNAGNTPYITMGTLTEMQIMIPPTKDEQTAIATVLSNMDTEIEKLESQLGKYKNIKQGMMQKLLTGKIRLIKK